MSTEYDIMEQQLAKCKTLLTSKNKEYSNEKSIIHNFDMASLLMGNLSVQALGGMMVKHTVSIYDMIQTYGLSDIDIDKWDEKITDHINYLLLLKVIITLDSQRNAEVYG